MLTGQLASPRVRRLGLSVYLTVAEQLGVVSGESDYGIAAGGEGLGGATAVWVFGKHRESQVTCTHHTVMFNTNRYTNINTNIHH